MSRLQISKHISADVLDQIESELISILTQRNMNLQRRVQSSAFYGALFLFGLLACGVGLLLAVLALVTSFGRPKEMMIFALFSAIFAFGLTFFANKDWLIRKLATRRARISNWISKRMARRMMTKARQAVPFIAEYDVRGTSLVYYRTKDDLTKVAWTRNISGLRMAATGFSLFFKKENAVYPHILVLHDASLEWDTHLDALGVKSIPKDQGEASPR